jgi:hypothetical protein
MILVFASPALKRWANEFRRYAADIPARFMQARFMQRTVMQRIFMQRTSHSGRYEFLQVKPASVGQARLFARRKPWDFWRRLFLLHCDSAS